MAFALKNKIMFSAIKKIDFEKNYRELKEGAKLLSMQWTAMDCPVYLECCRSYWVSRLRKRFREIWQEVLQCKPPKEAFNEWFLEGLARRPTPVGPLLDPVAISPVPGLSSALVKYVLLRKPLELKYPKTVWEARENLEMYLEACEVCLGKEVVREGRKQVLEVLSDGWSGVLEVVRKGIYPLLTVTLEPLIHELGERLSQAVCELKQDLDITDLLSKSSEQRVAVHRDDKVRGMCRFSVDKNCLNPALRNQNTVYDVNTNRVQQLETQFEALKEKTQGLLGKCHFHEAAWCMLHRYQSLFGPGGIGSGWHLATPRDVMGLLGEMFHVQTECFASPLNFFFPSHCSVYPDIDMFFGSVGTFSDLKFDDGGSFQAGPPYTLNIMEEMVTKFHQALTSIEKPLSFFCVVPDWEDSKPIQELKQSKYNRASFSLAKEEHYYMSGFQHFSKQKHLHARFECATYVCWLQNASGFLHWPPLEDQIRRVRCAFAPV